MTGSILEVPETEREYLVVTPPRGALGSTLLRLGWIVMPIVPASMYLYQLWQHSGLPDVISIEPRAAEPLRFTGGLRQDVLHRRHPLRGATYTPAADYNPYVLKDKMSELVRILAAAGAISAEISGDSSQTVSFAANASNAFGQELGGTLSSKRIDATRLHWSFRGAGVGTYELPYDLCWFDTQPEWQSMWESVVHHGVKYHNLVLEQENSIAIESSLAAKFGKAGFNLGGSFQDMAQSRISIEVHFA